MFNKHNLNQFLSYLNMDNCCIFQPVFGWGALPTLVKHAKKLKKRKVRNLLQNLAKK